MSVCRPEVVMYIAGGAKISPFTLIKSLSQRYAVPSASVRSLTVATFGAS